MTLKRKIPLALELYKVAEDQCGYFTASQAKASGYKDSNTGYYIRRGYWSRCVGDVYRLEAFPSSKHEKFVLYALWSHNKAGVPQCIFSHLSALHYYDLLHEAPTLWHMTKSSKCRLAKKIPENFVFYKANLKTEDIIDIGNFKVTSPQRTFFDILESNLLSADPLPKIIAQSIIREFLPLDFFEENLQFAIYLEKVYAFIQSYIQVEMAKVMAFETRVKR